MIGIIIGTAAVLGACAYARRRRHRYHRGHCGHRNTWGHGGSRDDRWSRGRGWGRGWGPGRWIDHLTERLDASPAQERVIHDVGRELFGDLRRLGKEAKATRGDLGAAFGTERLDEERMGELFARHDELLESARKALVGALARIHDVLDPQQREQLSRLLGRRDDFGPYSGSGSYGSS